MTTQEEDPAYKDRVKSYVKTTLEGLFEVTLPEKGFERFFNDYHTATLEWKVGRLAEGWGNLNDDSKAEMKKKWLEGMQENKNE